MLTIQFVEHRGSAHLATAVTLQLQPTGAVQCVGVKPRAQYIVNPNLPTAKGSTS